jgi:hypothetical protein
VNSILANSGGQYCGSVTDGGHNIVDNASHASCNFGTNADPLLDPNGLRNNGGPTQTIGLQSTSPAIDAIPIALCPNTDQRGFARPDSEDSTSANPACDVGAFEFGASNFCPPFVGDAIISGSMEGNLPINPGDTVKAGYDFTIPGSHPADTITAITGNVTLPVSCPDGSVQTLTITLPNQSYAVPQNDSSWFPSGDQKSSLVYQGSVTAPVTLCGGLQGHAPKGATFTMKFGASASSKFNVRFHYSDNSAGGWSGTLGVQPSVSSACF